MKTSSYSFSGQPKWVKYRNTEYQTFGILTDPKLTVDEVKCYTLFCQVFSFFIVFLCDNFFKVWFQKRESPFFRVAYIATLYIMICNLNYIGISIFFSLNIVFYTKHFFSSASVKNHQSYRLVYQEWWTLRLTLQYLQFFSPKELHFSTNKIHMVFTFAYCTELCKTVLLDIYYLLPLSMYVQCTCLLLRYSF